MCMFIFVKNQISIKKSMNFEKEMEIIIFGKQEVA